jgi:hypothetical protein
VADLGQIGADSEFCEGMLEFFNALLNGLDLREIPEWIEFEYALVIGSAPHLDNVIDTPGEVLSACRQSPEAMIDFLNAESGRIIAGHLIQQSKWRREIRTGLIQLGIDLECLE